MNAKGHKTLPVPVAPPRCLAALGSIREEKVGMREIKRPTTTATADRNFLLVGTFFKKRNLF